MAPVRAPRRLAAGAVLAALAGTLLLAVLVSAWVLVAVPFEVVGAVALWLGLSNDEVLDVLSTVDDAGTGPAGMHPA